MKTITNIFLILCIVCATSSASALFIATQRWISPTGKILDEFYDYHIFPDNQDWLELLTKQQTDFIWLVNALKAVAIIEDHLTFKHDAKKIVNFFKQNEQAHELGIIPIIGGPLSGLAYLCTKSGLPCINVEFRTTQEMATKDRKQAQKLDLLTEKAITDNPHLHLVLAQGTYHIAAVNSMLAKKGWKSNPPIINKNLYRAAQKSPEVKAMLDNEFIYHKAIVDEDINIKVARIMVTYPIDIKDVFQSSSNHVTYPGGKPATLSLTKAPAVKEKKVAAAQHREKPKAAQRAVSKQAACKSKSKSIPHPIEEEEPLPEYPYMEAGEISPAQ